MSNLGALLIVSQPRLQSGVLDRYTKQLACGEKEESWVLVQSLSPTLRCSSFNFLGETTVRKVMHYRGSSDVLIAHNTPRLGKDSKRELREPRSTAESLETTFISDCCCVRSTTRWLSQEVWTRTWTLLIGNEPSGGESSARSYRAQSWDYTALGSGGSELKCVQSLGSPCWDLTEYLIQATRSGSQEGEQNGIRVRSMFEVNRGGFDVKCNAP